MTFKFSEDNGKNWSSEISLLDLISLHERFPQPPEYKQEAKHEREFLLTAKVGESRAFYGNRLVYRRIA